MSDDVSERSGKSAKRPRHRPRPPGAICGEETKDSVAFGVIRPAELEIRNLHEKIDHLITRQYAGPRHQTAIIA
jgi:hypothetical protein